MFAVFGRIWRRLFGPRPRVLSPAQLGVVVDEVQRVAAASQRQIADQYAAYLHDYFEGGPEGYRAKTLTVDLPGRQLQRIPLFALVPPRQVHLDRLSLRFSIAATDADLARATVAKEAANEDVRVEMVPAGDATLMDVQVTVSTGAIPAALQQVIDESAGRLQRAIQRATVED